MIIVLALSSVTLALWEQDPAEPTFNWPKSATKPTTDEVAAKFWGSSNCDSWRNAWFGCGLTEKCCGSTCASNNICPCQCVGKGRKDDFIVYAHGMNSVEGVRWASSIGVNGIEIDLDWDQDTDQPFRTYHGAPCDCTCMASFRAGGDSTCKNGGSCNSEANVKTLLAAVATLPSPLSVLYVDSKLQNEMSGDKLRTQGRNLGKILVEDLFRKVTNCSSVSCVDILNYDVCRDTRAM